MEWAEESTILAQDRQEVNNIRRLKRKLTNVCKAIRFCGICLDCEGKLWAVGAEFDIAVGQQTHKIMLKDIIDYILNDVGHQILASMHLCSDCTEKSIQSYLFIYNAKQLSKILYKCVDELNSKTVDVHDRLEQLSNDYNNSNIVIVLEQDSEMCQYTDIGKMTEIVAKETPKEFIEEVELTVMDDNCLQVETIDPSNTPLKISEMENNERVTVETIEPITGGIIETKEGYMELQILEQKEEKHVKTEEIDLNNAVKSEEVVNNIEILEDTVNDKEQIQIFFLDEDLDVSAPEYFSDIENEVTKVKTSLSSRKKKKLSMQSSTHKCKRCREILPSYKGLKEHEKICKKVKFDPSKPIFTCKICNETFVTQRSLNTHYKSHSRIRCKVCQFLVPQEELTEHMKINHEDYIHSCKLCKFFSFNADTLKVHMKKSHSGSKCALCFRKVKESYLKLHRCRYNCVECVDNVCMHYKYLLSYKEQVLNNVTKIKCPDCDYICPRREALLGHVNREHLDHHPFTCDNCSQQFYSRTTLRYHINRFHKDRFVCNFCDQEFSSLYTLNNHKETCQIIERPNKCDQCSSSFATLEELSDHVKLRHDKLSLGCNLCKRQFLSSSKLQEHMFRVHNGLQMKRKKSLLVCPVCDVKFETKKQLMGHIEDHGPDVRFPCKNCDADFDSITKLLVHVRIHYDDVIQCIECKKIITTTFYPHHMVYCKPGRDDTDVYTCESCGKTYNSAAQLKWHHKTHMEKTPCPICKKPTKPVYMKNHMRFMHGKTKKGNKSPKINTTIKANKSPKIKTKTYIKCNQCDHLVSRYGELETHMNRYHLKIKPYKCNHCQKSFFGKERLRDHLITHTTTKLCYCSVCNQKFENNACLKLHMRRHTGDTPYACEICGERFRTSSIMNVHKVKKHTERTVSCPLCGTMFHLTREMRSHFKKVHWKQKGKKFDPRDIKELNPAFYHLFEDGRVPKVEGEELYISRKFNEKFDS